MWLEKEKPWMEDQIGDSLLVTTYKCKKKRSTTQTYIFWSYSLDRILYAMGDKAYQEAWASYPKSNFIGATNIDKSSGRGNYHFIALFA